MMQHHKYQLTELDNMMMGKGDLHKTVTSTSRRGSEKDASVIVKIDKE